MAKEVNVERLPILIKPDPMRVLVRPFHPTSGFPTGSGDAPRIFKIIARVLALSEEEVERQLSHVRADFAGRHIAIDDVFRQRFAAVKPYLPTDEPLSNARQLLIGSYFTLEYSLESAAVFNPSIVPHPDQSGLPDGAVRFIMSLRSTGEGHISSITFRSGTIDAEGNVSVDTPRRFVREPRPIPDRQYDKALFHRKLTEIGIQADFTTHVMDALEESFTLDDLKGALRVCKRSGRFRDSDEVARHILLLAESNYQTEFLPEQSISERIIFPFSPSQSNGIEDARFVRFTDDDGEQTYYGTYTAYDGRMILPQLIETRDFLRFSISTLNGPAIQNKGMALFPRKVNGHYVMLSRQDNENIHLMISDHVHFWYESQVIVRPRSPWEFVQMGNCGSPVETEWGWLVLTHGVGAMRKYCIGALILDRDEPWRVVARLLEPLLTPSPTEREGYVPNVVYTCGFMVHRENLIIPYAVSDSATSFARVKVRELVEAMEWE